MSRMGSTKAGRRARRQFSEEFRIGAVRLVLDAGKTVGAVARELDLTPSTHGIVAVRDLVPVEEEAPA